MKRFYFGVVLLVMSFANTSAWSQGTTLKSADTSSDPYRIQALDIPSDYRQAFEFLNFIKFPKEPTGEFQATEAPKWNVAQFMSFFSANGIVVTDVNDSGRHRYSSDQIKTSITTRKGKLFVTFAHLAHIYSIPYREYSELKFESIQNGVVIRVASWYKLTFMRENGRLRLVQCDYLTEEGD